MSATKIYYMESMKVLILAGGYSSRMGSPKHLLPFAGGPLYLQLVRILHGALPNITTHHISLADRSVTDEVLHTGEIQLCSGDDFADKTIALKIVTDAAAQDIGPAAGLLAAHNYDTAATWLVIACDYPLLESTAVEQLVESYEEPATCFRNEEGFGEPLLGIWSPQALRSLKRNVENGRSGPNYTLKHLGSKLIAPTRKEWLINVNTKQEWKAAQALMHGPQSSDGT
jgi:molybdopterin-guanine dinucleotide biosynthesis protein A